MTLNAEVYRRADGKWAFRIRHRNGNIVATDGGQSYERRIDAQTVADSLIPPEYERLPIPDDELEAIAGDLADNDLPGDIHTARLLVQLFDLEIERDHYGRRADPDSGYSASRWVSPWSKDQ